MASNLTVDSRWAWVIVVSSFLSRLLHEGFLKSLGVLLPALSVHFGVPVWAIGNTISLMTVIGKLSVRMDFISY